MPHKKYTKTCWSKRKASISWFNSILLNLEKKMRTLLRSNFKARVSWRVSRFQSCFKSQNSPKSCRVSSQSKHNKQCSSSSADFNRLYSSSWTRANFHKPKSTSLHETTTYPLSSKTTPVHREHSLNNFGAELRITRKTTVFVPRSKSSKKTKPSSLMSPKSIYLKRS